MDRVVGEITERLIGLLPENQSFYTPQDLLVSKIPSFLVERVVLELKRNLADSVVPPETEWADMNSESVRKAWSAFLDAIRAETRLPSSYVKSVFESAVGDVIDLLVEPRKQIPEYLFDRNTELTYEEVVERSRWIVVYPHFKSALPRYMEKKGLDRIDRTRCEKLIRALDEKLSSGYSTVGWAQLIEPWYQLMGEEIESDLLRRFFVDKDKQVMAGRFDQEDGAVSRSRFIEIVSKPEYETEVASDEPVDEQPDMAAVADSETPPETSSPRQQEAEEEANSIIEQFGSLKSDDEQEDEEQEDNRQYAYSEWQGDQETSEDEPEEPEESDVKESELTSSIEETGEAWVKQSTQPESEGVEEDEASETDEEDSDEVPMWQRFVGGESDDSGLGLSRDEDEDEDDQEGNPVIDIRNVSESKGDDEYHRLMGEISDVRDYFIEELFSGDEPAFERCMEHIVTFNTWSEAAKFITQEVFRRNMVDMYSDVAVEFTDRMQTFFLQKT